MKKINFLTKLYVEGKLDEVEPSTEIKKAYLQRSEESLLSSKTLFKIGNLKDSVTLSYYAMYYFFMALFSKIRIKCENHTDAIILLKDVFDIDNSNILNAKFERVDKQYYVDFNVNKDQCK